MGDNSAIQWTDATWNWVTGCTKVSPGCANCYIDSTPPFRMAKPKRTFDQNGTTGLMLYRDRLEMPIRWKRPRKIFMSLMDPFHEEIPRALLVDAFAVMAAAHWHTYQVLTKRAERMFETLNDPLFVREVSASVERLAKAYPTSDLRDSLEGWPIPNVWFGVSVENQRWLSRVAWLLTTPAAVRFLSVEPLLSSVDLDGALWQNMALSEIPAEALDDGCSSGKMPRNPGIDWVIVGGESGHRARFCDIRWVRSIVEQCKTADVPCFVKQLGSRPLMWSEDGLLDISRFRKKFLKHRKGGDPTEWPEDLRVREFPEVLEWQTIPISETDAAMLAKRKLMLVDIQRALLS